ncbi:MAG: endonuclease domain-containing protein [Proteobacteria bacterium]|nr:endonuclease domain-containing protein [Pseudomonadota bacterium]
MSTRKAKELRQNRTEAEKRLWERLRRKRIDGFSFRQQAPIGKYIIDFVCFEPNLVVELDGGQHAGQVEYDTRRTEWLESQGFRVLRFWNNEVFENIEGVEEVIQAALRSPGGAHPLPNPPPSRGRE